MAKTKIVHTQGNMIDIMFPINEIYSELYDGELEVQDDAISINGDVWVILSRGTLIRQYKANYGGNYIWIHDHGHLPCGEYDIEVRLNDPSYNIPLRYKEEKILTVVDTTAEGHIYEGTDYNVITYYPIINGRASAVVIGPNSVSLMTGNGLSADIGEDSVNLRAGHGESTIDIDNNNIKINIKD